MRPRRGEVTPLVSPKIGFRRPVETELVMVLQVDRATRHLSTAIVAPVEARFDPDRLLDFDVVVLAADLGIARDHVVHVHLMRAVLLDALQGEPVGAADPATMARVLRAERLLLG